jgi:hypothetical protein
MGQFSDDGRWWWDGQTWVPTAQVVLPQLPATEFEKSGRLDQARADRRQGRWLFWTAFGPLAWLITVVYFPAWLRVFRAYRMWTIEQLAFATAYLLGPDEPMLAGEVSANDLGDSWTRDLAVAITAGHVIVFRIDSVDGQPRWIAMVGRPPDVKLEPRSGALGWLYPALVISSRNGRYVIRGYPGQFNPDLVLVAWRKAVSSTAATR